MISDIFWICITFGNLLIASAVAVYAIIGRRIILLGLQLEKRHRELEDSINKFKKDYGSKKIIFSLGQDEIKFIDGNSFTIIFKNVTKNGIKARLVVIPPDLTTLSLNYENYQLAYYRKIYRTLKPAPTLVYKEPIDMKDVKPWFSIQRDEKIKIPHEKELRDRSGVAFCVYNYFKAHLRFILYKRIEKYTIIILILGIWLQVVFILREQ